MKLKHMIGRGIFSFFGSILLSVVLASGFGLFIGFVSFIVTAFIPPLSVNAALIGFIVGGALGFLYGSYHGFKIGNFLYQKYIEKNTIIAEPTFLSGRDDSITHANALIRDIRELPAPTHSQIHFLTKDEIFKYREIITDRGDRIARKKLNQYEDFVKDARNLSLSRGKNLQLLFPITIEHKKEPASLAKTYERNFIITILEKEKEHAKEPLKGYFLTSPNIHFYSGFPDWIQNFIQTVRNILHSHHSNFTKIEKEAKSDNFGSNKPLFQPAKNNSENIENTIKEFNKKFGRS